MGGLTLISHLTLENQSQIKTFKSEPGLEEWLHLKD